MAKRKKKIVNRYETYIIPVLCMLMSWHLMALFYFAFVWQLIKDAETYFIASACMVIVSVILLFKRKFAYAIPICLIGMYLIYHQLIVY